MNDGVAHRDRGRRGARAAPPRDRLRRPADRTTSTRRSRGRARRRRPRRARVDRAGRQRGRDRARPGRRAGERFDVVTDQTSRARRAQRLRAGRPALDDAADAATRPPRRLRRALDGVDGRPRPRDARVPGGRRGHVRLRQQPPRPGAGGRRRERVRLPGLRARRSSGRCSARARARSAGRRCRAIPEDILRTDRAVLELFPEDAGPPALDRDGRGARAVPGPAGADLLAGLRRAGEGRRSRSTSWSRTGEVEAPIVIGRDHLDAGSVASPNRETEAMRDGSDAIADWPLLNALVNTAAGATWVTHPPRRRRRASATASTRAWSSWPTARSSRRRSSSGSSRPTRAWASCATPTRATSARSRSPGERGVRIPMLDDASGRRRVPRRPSSADAQARRPAPRLGRPASVRRLGS